MADRIKGITIEFSGDATKLNSTLKAIRKETNAVDGSLKQVNKALKFSPTSTVLLGQKQTLLKSKVDACKQSLVNLKAAQAKMDAKGVAKNSAEYQKLQREIVITESKLKNYQKQLNGLSSPKMTALSNQFKAVGSKATAAGKALAPVSAATGALGVVAVKSAADFDAQMSKVKAISGATSKDFDMLRGVAIKMGNETKFSATEAGQGLEYMAMAGWKSEDMAKGLPGIMKLAAASNEDLGTTSDIVTDALTAFGLSAKDSAHFADVLAAASSNSNTNVSMMGETFKYATPVAGALGYKAEDTALAIGLMANAGIKSTQAGTSLRTGMTNLIKPTDAAASAMKKLGISAKDQSGQVKPLSQLLPEMRKKFAGLTKAEKVQYASTIFGKNAMAGWLAILNGSDKDFNKLSNAINNSSGAADKMSSEMNNNLSGQITILKGQLQTLAISFGETVAPFLTKFVQGLQNVVAAFSGLPTPVKTAIMLVGGIVTAATPLLLLFGALSASIGAVIGVLPMLATGFGVVATGFKALMALLVANPFGAFLALLTAALLFVVSHWEWCEKITEKVWTAIKTAVCGAINGIKSVIGTVVSTISKVVSAAWNAVKGATSKVWGGIKNTISTITGGIGRVVSKVVSTIKSLFGGLSSVTGRVSKTFTAVKGAITTPVETAKKLVTSAIRKISDVVGGVKLSLPHFKLPHISASGGKAPYGIGGKGSLPKFSVKWYAKGGIFDNPSLIGVGEAGSEAVVPIDRLWESIGAMGDSISNSILGGLAMMSSGGNAPINITLYAAPNGQKLDEIVVKAYDRGKRRMG